MDWRLQGQETFLQGVQLYKSEYTPYRVGWDHDHCEFCGKKFSLNNEYLSKGYRTENGYHWICCDCFNDFKQQFQWKVTGGSLP